MNKQDKSRPSMGDLLKGMPTPATPVQEVRPVSPKAQDDLVRINGFWAEPDLARRMKLFSASTDMKNREILIAALEAYLPK